MNLNIFILSIFKLGDGAGVGKGRTLAGIIYENYLLGRKRALWYECAVPHYCINMQSSV